MHICYTDISRKLLAEAGLCHKRDYVGDEIMKKCLIGVMALLLILTTGCTGEQADTTMPTVENLFSQPTTEPTVLETEPVVLMDSWITHWSLPEYSVDEVAHYVSYEGGEMCLPFAFDYMGDGLAEYGVAIMVVVDGQLQPFRTSEDDTLKYVHRVYPPASAADETVTLDLLFTPIAGQTGDMMDISIVTKQFTDWEWGDAEYPFHGYLSSISTRLKYQDTPLRTERLESDSRVLSWSCTYQDATMEEFQDWSRNFMSKLNTCLRIDGTGYTWNKQSEQWWRNAYTVSADVPMELTIELVDPVGIEYGILIFMDDEPVSTNPEDIIFVDAAAGQKATIKVEIDMFDFDGQSKVYALIVPRNVLSTMGYDTKILLDLTGTLEYYLFSNSLAEGNGE